MAAENESLIFHDCVFCIVPSKEIDEGYNAHLANSIENGSGEVRDIRSDGIIDFDGLTHIISTTSDFPQYLPARSQLISVVTPAWVTHSLLKSKQAQIRPYTPDPNLFYSNVNISCADIPKGDQDAIIGAVLALGGMESSSLTKVVTHVCALTMDHPKCQQIRERNLKIKIVLPHWFDDCLRLGKRIDDAPYLLPDPEILRKNADETVPIPATAQLKGATSSRPENFPIPTDSPSRNPLTVFKNKKVMLAEDLDINKRLRKIIEDLIAGGGGSITHTVHNANIFVCHWREGRDFVFAARMGIDVGNLSWLYYLITHNQWTSPMRRLLHYPLPRGGIPGFDGTRITLSNYGGEARIYLENLVAAAGGNFTKSMKQDNTHLITARKNSEKCSAAEEWNIEMINHLWIEESYAKCHIQKLTDPRYTHFPPRTNLGEVIGMTQFDPDVLERLYFSRDSTPSPDDPKTIRRPAMQEKDRNSSAKRKSGVDVAMGGMDDEDAEDDQPKPKKVATSRRPRVSDISNVSTPASRRVSAGKENDTPSSTGSRSAKDKALNRLHGLAPDIALYEKEKKRKGAVWGGDRAANKIEKEKEKQKSAERSSSPAVDLEDEHSESERAKKRAKTKSKNPPAEIRLMITGYKGWIGNLHKEDVEKKKLRELGILVVQDATNCTHLAAPHMVRTMKFLCAVASGPVIVSTDFIDTCLKEGEVPDIEDFLLKDLANEKNFNVKLKDVLTRAKANKRSLLRRKVIYCTAEIANGPETYQAIVKANGGDFNIYRGKGGAMIKPTKPEEDDGEPEPAYLLTGPRPDERRLWPKFTEMAEKGNMIPRIVHAEWLLDVAMSQQLKWGNHYLAIND